MTGRRGAAIRRAVHDQLGLTVLDVAATLVISVRIAETHVQHIMDKLGCGTRAQIAAWSAAQPPR